MDKFVVFDLDGTLVDTLPGIQKGLNITLKELNFNYSYSLNKVKTFIGRGARRLFALATKNKGNEEDFKHYLRNYEKYQYDVSAFDGVIDTLKELEKRSYKLLIFSNKPDHILQKLIKEKLNEAKFLVIQGQDNNYPPKPDITLLSLILNKYNLDIKNGYYVGDSIVDLETARNIKMKNIIVSYGYGDKEEILKAKPDYYIDKFSEILKIL